MRQLRQRRIGEATRASCNKVAGCLPNAPELSRGAECEILNQTAWRRRRLQLLVRSRPSRLRTWRWQATLDIQTDTPDIVGFANTQNEVATITRREWASHGSCRPHERSPFKCLGAGDP